MSKNPDTKQVCGNCMHFVAGGKCEIVKGIIKANDTCDLFDNGNPKPLDTDIAPTYSKDQVNYKHAKTETVPGDIAAQAIQMEHELLQRGVSEEEAHRAVVAYFSQQEPPNAMPWPGPVTGLDLAGGIDPFRVPDSGTPLTDFAGLPSDVQPFPTASYNPYPNNPTPDSNSLGSLSNTYDFVNPPNPTLDMNWAATASQFDSQPSMHGEYGFNVQKAIPEWRYPIEQSQSQPLEIPNITIPPSGTQELTCIRKISEAISSLRAEFAWLGEDYIKKAKELSQDAKGTLYLVRAAGETITDHTGEGEPYRRKLSADELNSMTRTAIGKKMDVNHQPEYETDATILDADFDKNRKEIQMLILERDPQINRAIKDKKITAVSINGGMPRAEEIEPCDHNCTSNCELCVVPKGVVLGEIDDIAMTYVVTDPNGLYWNGHFIPKAEPGIKFTKIEPL